MRKGFTKQSDGIYRDAAGLDLNGYANCSTCHNPTKLPACDNPACPEGKSEATKAHIAARAKAHAERRAADETRIRFRASIRRAHGAAAL